MRESRHTAVQQEILSPSRFSIDSFSSNNRRSLYEFTNEDTAVILEHDLTLLQIAMRMQNITDIAAENLGEWARVDDKTITRITQNQGVVDCPFLHSENEYFNKEITIVRHTGLSRAIRWSDLKIHLIAIHGFFGDKASDLRIEPEDLIELLFDINEDQKTIAHR